MKPIIGITMGDAAGVGPEIIVKALGHREVYEQCRPVVLGDAKIMNRALSVTGSDLMLGSVHSIQECVRTGNDRLSGSEPAAGGSALRPAVGGCGRCSVPVPEAVGRTGQSRRYSGDLYSSAEQRSPAYGRPPLSWAYGNFGRFDRDGRLFHDAILAQAEGDSSDDASGAD